MSDAFSEFYNNADKELSLLVDSDSISSSEKRKCIDAFINALYSSSFSGDSYPSVKKIVTVASTKYIDSVFAEIINKSLLSKEDVDNVNRISIRQMANMDMVLL